MGRQLADHPAPRLARLRHQAGFRQDQGQGAVHLVPYGRTVSTKDRARCHQGVDRGRGRRALFRARQRSRPFLQWPRARQMVVGAARVPGAARRPAELRRFSPRCLAGPPPHAAERRGRGAIRTLSLAVRARRSCSMKQFGIGQPVRRVEDRRFITGHGVYVDDISRPRQAHAFMLRSPHAHARIGAIDTAAALAASGVIAVLTGQDLVRDGIGDIPCLSVITNRDGSQSVLPPHPAIAHGRVRHVGDTVAVVVAESAAVACDAAELIAVDYESLPAVVDTRHALDPGQPQVWDEAPGNLCFDWEVGDGPAVERAMTAARHRISLELVNNRVVVNSMEPRGAVGEYDPGEDAYTLWSSTQGSHFVRNLLAANVFHVPENRIRVVTRDVGGGFGMKLFLYPEHVLVLWAAKKLGRPVKWTPDRADAFMTDTQGRDNVTRLELGLDG